MSKYTTGEIAKLCGVTVRTVQYYDTRGILTPSELTEGGRRLYSEDDVKRMKVICFLRDLGLPIDAIGQLLSEEDPGSVISLLLDQQEQALRKEIGDREDQLRRLEELKSGLKSVSEFLYRFLRMPSSGSRSVKLPACQREERGLGETSASTRFSGRKRAIPALFPVRTRKLRRP